MTTIKEALFNRLSNFSGLSTLVASRIYRGHLPQSLAAPCVLYTRIGNRHVESLQGSSGLAVAVFQVDCFGRTDTEAESVAEQIRLALQGFSGVVGDMRISGIRLLQDRDDFEDDPELVRRILEFEVMHEEVIPGA